MAAIVSGESFSPVAGLIPDPLTSVPAPREFPMNDLPVSISPFKADLVLGQAGAVIYAEFTCEAVKMRQFTTFENLSLRKEWVKRFY